MDSAVLNPLLQEEWEAAGVEPLLRAPHGVQVRRRSGDGKSYLLVLNHNDAPASVDVLDGGTDRLSGRPVSGTVELEPFGVLVLQEAGAEEAGFEEAPSEETTR